MKSTVYGHDFIRAFQTSEYKDSFSYEGLVAIYSYITDIERELQDEIELDVISIACTYTEYSSIHDLLSDLIHDTRRNDAMVILDDITSNCMSADEAFDKYREFVSQQAEDLGIVIVHYTADSIIIER